MWTLNDLLNIANGSSLIKNDLHLNFHLVKKIKVHQLYEYIKSIREYVYNRDIPQSTCLCEICENVCYEWAKVRGKSKESC